MAYYEIRQWREIQYLRKYYWRGRRTFLSTEPIADSTFLLGDYWPASGHFPRNSTPICVRTRAIYDPGNPPVVGVNLLVAEYETSGVGFFRIDTQSMPHRIKKLYGLNANENADGDKRFIIEGPEDDGIHVWQCVSGNNIVDESFLRVRVDTSYYADDIPYPAIGDLIDRVNIGTFTFGDFSAGDQTFWLRRVTTSNKRSADIVDVSFYFDWLRQETTLGWNGRITAQRGCWVVVKRKVLNQTNSTKYVMEYHAGKEIVDATADPVVERDSTLEYRMIIRQGDFSTLGFGNMIQW